MNPYAPPAAIEDRSESDSLTDGLIWRDGDLMVIRSGAALPRKCFVTGQATSSSFAVVQNWQPKWVNLWLLAGILPYFLVAPFYRRDAKLTVPISHAILRSHLRRVSIGFVMMLVGLVLGTAGLVAGHPLALSAETLVMGVLCALLGFFLSSGQPISLKIVSLEGDLMVLKNVHSDCLKDLPSVGRSDDAGIDRSD